METTAIAIASMTDNELAALYHQNGEQHWLAALYQRYHALLLGVCFKYLQNTELAQDACSDIYEELVIKLRRHQVEYPKAWLHTLAKNHCLQKLRSSKAITISEFPEEFVQSEDAWHLEDVMQKEKNLQAMQQCMEHLMSEQKQTVTLFYLQEKCYNEIVGITGLPWNTVRSHIQNGRRNLKKCMEKTNRE